MKKLTVLVMALITVVSIKAQSKAEAQVKAKVEAVHKAVFVNKDSAALEQLFAKEITYGHSGGKLQDRSLAVEEIGHNKSTYTGIHMGEVSVIVNGKTAVSRYVLTGTETNKDGKVTELKLNILQVWVKERRDWKMMARQAVKVS